MEIRGIGIIDVEKMFGASALMDSTKIDLVIKLEPYEYQSGFNRIGDDAERFTNILNVLVPTITLPISAGRNVAVLVESAVTNFRLQGAGYNSAEELRRRFREYAGREDS
jgi:HPr kinase/phosphorylase